MYNNNIQARVQGYVTQHSHMKHEFALCCRLFVETASVYFVKRIFTTLLNTKALAD